MLYILIPLSLAVIGTLVWAWWQDRLGRDPVNSIDSFHRALTAMEPGAVPESNGDGSRHRVIDLEDSADAEPAPAHPSAQTADGQPEDVPVAASDEAVER